MNDLKYKILAQWFSGILLGIVFGIIGLLNGMMIGGNYGCLPIINSMFGTRGYESCGSFGGLLGLIGGAVLGVLALHFLAIKNYRRLFLILGFILLLPIIFFIIIILSNPTADSGLTSLSAILKVMMWPLISSALLVLLVNAGSLMNMFRRPKKT